MKKTLFLAVFAGVALAGCVKNEEVAMSNDSSPERIKFDAPVVSVPTRATEIVGKYPKEENFAVYALYHVGDFTTFGAAGTQLYMNNVTCEANKKGADETPDYWAPTPNYYWPKNDNSMLTFAAYAPAGMISIPDSDTGTAEGVKWDATGFTFQNFKVKDTSADQIDLLYSERVYNQTKETMVSEATPDNTNNPYSGVTILFKHALSSIVFTAKASVANTVKLIGIKVNNVISTGTFKQGYPADGSRGDEAAGWTFATNPERKSYDVFKADEGEQMELSTEKMYFEGTITDENGKRKSDLILIPQQLNADGNQVNVSITYSINGVEDTKTFNLAVKNTSGDGDVAVYMWEKGYRYTYNIEIGLDEIHFNPTVDVWETQDGTGIQSGQPDTTI